MTNLFKGFVLWIRLISKHLCWSSWIFKNCIHVIIPCTKSTQCSQMQHSAGSLIKNKGKQFAHMCSIYVLDCLHHQKTKVWNFLMYYLLLWRSNILHTLMKPTKNIFSNIPLHSKIVLFYIVKSFILNILPHWVFQCNRNVFTQTNRSNYHITQDTTHVSLTIMSGGVVFDSQICMYSICLFVRL